MELINTPDNKFVDADPSTLTAGTPIPASFMNAVQGEISNVVTGYGLTIDPTNDAQMKAALDKQFAPINSPSLTGIPLTTNPDGKTDNQIATVAFVKQYGTETSLGYQAVQQSGGTDQGSNKIYIGADSSDANQVRVQVDSTDIGRLVFQEDDDSTYGVSKIGFNHVSDQFAFYNTGTKTWQFCYTTTQIDSKSYISSLPTGNNESVTNIIWNESSNLPAYYYGPNDTVTYSATTDWTTSNFLNLNTGGNVTGGIVTTKYLAGGYGGGWNGARTNSGDYAWTNGIAFGSPANDGKYKGQIQVTDVLDQGTSNSSGINLTGYDSAGTTYQWYFAWNGNVTTPKGVLAFESDVTNLQNQINTKQAAGDYAQASELAAGTFDGSQGSTTSGTIVGGTWLRVGNTLTQNLVIENIGGGTVTYPIPFSGNDNQVTVIVQDGTGSNSTFTTGSITTTGTGIHASGGGGTGRMHLTVSGPYGT